MEAHLQQYAPAFNEVARELGVEGMNLVYIGLVAGMIVGCNAQEWNMQRASFFDWLFVNSRAECPWSMMPRPWRN